MNYVGKKNHPRAQIVAKEAKIQQTVEQLEQTYS